MPEPKIVNLMVDGKYTHNYSRLQTPTLHIVFDKPFAPANLRDIFYRYYRDIPNTPLFTIDGTFEPEVLGLELPLKQGENGNVVVLKSDLAPELMSDHAKFQALLAEAIEAVGMIPDFLKRRQDQEEAIRAVGTAVGLSVKLSDWLDYAVFTAPDGTDVGYRLDEVPRDAQTVLAEVESRRQKSKQASDERTISKQQKQSTAAKHGAVTVRLNKQLEAFKTQLASLNLIVEKEADDAMKATGLE